LNKDVKRLALEMVSTLANGIVEEFNLDQDIAIIELLKALNSNIVSQEIHNQIAFNLEGKEVKIYGQKNDWN